MFSSFEIELVQVTFQRFYVNMLAICRNHLDNVAWDSTAFQAFRSVMSIVQFKPTTPYKLFYPSCGFLTPHCVSFESATFLQLLRIKSLLLASLPPFQIQGSRNSFVHIGTKSIYCMPHGCRILVTKH